jgi:hypothetical protein
MKAPMRLAKQRYVIDPNIIEKEVLRFDNECAHTHNIEGDSLKHQKINRRNYEN